VALFSGPFGVNCQLFARVLAGLMVVYFLPESESDMVLTQFASQWLPPVFSYELLLSPSKVTTKCKAYFNGSGLSLIYFSEYAVENLAKLLAYLDATLSFSSVFDNSCKKRF
jgi:hypothetical protein